MSKVLQNHKATISLGGVELFCLFIACSYTSMKATVLSCRLVGCGAASPKFSEATNKQYFWKGSCDFVDFLQVVIRILLDIHWSYKNIFWAGIVRHSLSANQIVRCFKLKKLKKDMRYQVDFFRPLKLEEILCYFELWPQNTLDQSVYRIFCFWLVWLVKFNTKGPLLYCTCSFLHCIFLFLFYPRINKPNIHNNVIGISSLQNGL